MSEQAQIKNISKTIHSHFKYFFGPKYFKINSISLVYKWERKSNTISLYNVKQNVFNSFNISETINGSAETIECNKHIYAIGGNLVSTVIDINTSHKTSTIAADMLEPRFLHGLTIYKRAIYSIGGSKGDYKANVISACEKYSISQNKWEKIPNLQINRSLCATFCIKSHIYSAGGSNSESMDLSSIERMNLNTNIKWEVLRTNGSIPPNRCLHGIAISNSEAIIFGGQMTKTDGSEQFTYSLKEVGDSAVVAKKCLENLGLWCWSTCSPMKVDGIVYEVECYERNLYCYSIAANKWKLLL